MDTKNTVNIFEQASRTGLLFDTPRGQATVTDLWRMPRKHTNPSVPNLYDIAKALNKQVQDVGDVPAFLQDEVKPADAEAVLALEIVKHIIEVRKAEELAKSQEQQAAAKKQRILELVAQKDDEDLQGKSRAELLELANSL